MTGIERRLIFAALTVLIVATMGTTVAVSQSGSRAWIKPGEQRVPPSGAFQAQVVIEGVQNLGGFELAVSYDPSVLEVTGASVGDFLTSSGREQIPLGPQVDNEDGIVALGAFTVGDAAGPDGSGVLATINGTVRSEGSSVLKLQDVQAVDTAAGVIPLETEDGRVVVEEGEAAVDETNGDSSATASPSVGSGPSAEETEQPTTADKPFWRFLSRSRNTGRTVRWGLVVAGLVLSAAGVAALVVGLRKHESDEESYVDSGGEDERGDRQP